MASGHPRVVGDVTRVTPTPRVLKVGSTHRKGVPRRVSLFYRGPPVLFLRSESVPKTPLGSYTTMVSPPTPKGGVRSQKDRRGHGPDPHSTSRTQSGSHVQRGHPQSPSGFAVLQGDPFPCPTVRKYPSNSVRILFPSFRFLLRPQETTSGCGRAVVNTTRVPQHLWDQKWVLRVQRVPLVGFPPFLRWFTTLVLRSESFPATP